MKSLLERRNELKAKKPSFRRQNAGLKKKLESSWRKPKGYQSKLRLRHKGKGGYVSPGYKSPKEVRGLSRAGLVIARVANVADLEALDPKLHTAMLVGSMGLKKRMAVIKACLTKGINVSNVKDIKAYLETNERAIMAKKEKKKLEAEKGKKKKASIEDKVDDGEQEGKPKAGPEQEVLQAQTSVDQFPLKDQQEKQKQEKDKLLTKRQ
jgi:large subunit ribosomal protein L32e